MAKEKPETKICKHCKSEIPYDAKICPQCRKKVKGSALKWILIGIAAIIIISAIAGGGSDKKGGDTKKIGTVSETAGEDSKKGAAPEEKKDEASENTPGETSDKAQDEAPSEPAKTEYYVGDILMDGNMKIVYMASGEYIEENDFLHPKEGNKYIFLKFAFENTSASSDDSISSFSFEAYADGYSAEKYFGGEDDLSATLSAGRATTGYIYFEVPINAENIEVEYECNIFTEEKIKFIYEGEKDSGYVPEPSAKATEGAYFVGDVVETSKLIITYLASSEFTSDNAFVQPREGYHFIFCEFEFENIGSSDIFVSEYNFDCYADGIVCDASYIREDSLSATLSAGRKTKGTVAFEVPDDAEIVEVEYLSDYWTSNRVVFTVEK